MTAALDDWRGQFGDDYTDRNRPTEENIRARRALFREILQSTVVRPDSVLEVGANIGANLVALEGMVRDRYAVEPNDRAREAMMRALGGSAVCYEGHAGSLDKLFQPDSFDLVFTSGVLIHIPPDDLLDACRQMHRVSKRYILSIEYFSRSLVAQPYRSPDERLWTRDFGSFWLDHFADLEPVSYGFCWKRTTGLDDVTWWLLEKRQ